MEDEAKKVTVFPKKKIPFQMTFRWDPSGSARLAFFEERKTAASVSQELIPDNLNANLLLIQQWAINEDLGSGLFFRALELVRSMKPGEMEFNQKPDLFIVLIWFFFWKKKSRTEESVFPKAIFWIHSLKSKVFFNWIR